MYQNSRSLSQSSCLWRSKETKLYNQSSSHMWSFTICGCTTKIIGCHHSCQLAKLAWYASGTIFNIIHACTSTLWLQRLGFGHINCLNLFKRYFCFKLASMILICLASFLLKGTVEAAHHPLDVAWRCSSNSWLRKSLGQVDAMLQLVRAAIHWIHKREIFLPLGSISMQVWQLFLSPFCCAQAWWFLW